MVAFTEGNLLADLETDLIGKLGSTHSHWKLETSNLLIDASRKPVKANFSAGGRAS